MVHRRVVEPRRGLGGPVRRSQESRRVRERREVDRREAVPTGGVGRVVERRPVDVGVGARSLGHVRNRADAGVVDVCRVRVAEDVSGVVGDDVEEDLHLLGVRLLDEAAELGVGAEVRVYLGEVGDPVAVVARTLRGTRALDRLVLERRCEPDRGRAETLDVAELLGQAGDVAAVVPPLARGVVARDVAVAGEAALVVGRVRVGEPVGHDEVEPLVGERPRSECCASRSGSVPVAAVGATIRLGGGPGEHERGDADSTATTRARTRRRAGRRGCMGSPERAGGTRDRTVTRPQRVKPPETIRVPRGAPVSGRAAPGPRPRPARRTRTRRRRRRTPGTGRSLVRTTGRG